MLVHPIKNFKRLSQTSEETNSLLLQQINLTNHTTKQLIDLQTKQKEQLEQLAQLISNELEKRLPEYKDEILVEISQTKSVTIFQVSSNVKSWRDAIYFDQIESESDLEDKLTQISRCFKR